MYRIGLAALLALLPLAAQAADGLECATFTSGGRVSNFGELFALGELAAGTATGDGQELRTGFIYCVTGEDCLGDVDGNGQVDLSDLATILSAFGACDGDPEYVPGADLSNDGCITLNDLATILALFGESC